MSALQNGTLRGILDNHRTELDVSNLICVLVESAALKCVRAIEIEMHECLLIDAAGEEAAVHRENVAGDETGCVGCEKDGGAGQFFKFSKASHWSTDFEFLAAFGAVQKACIEFRAKNPRSNRIYANTFAGPFDGERFCERSNSGLAGGIRSDFIERDKRREGGNINDASVTAFDHVTANDAACSKRTGVIGFQDAVPFSIWNGHSWRAFDSARAIHKNLHAAEFRDGGLEQLCNRSFVGDVAGGFEGPAAKRANFFCRGFDEVLAAARGDDVCARFRKPFGDFESDAARATDDQRRLAVQFQLRMSHEISAPLMSQNEVRFYRSEGAIEQ